MSNQQQKRKSIPKGRTRQIHIGACRNERLIECSFEARLFYLCLNCFTDKNDVVRPGPDQYEAIFFLGHESSYDEMIAELIEADLAVYEGERLRMLHVSESFCVTQRSQLETYYAANRRAARRQAMPSWADREKIAAVYRRARELTESTGEDWHVDHSIPLQHDMVCGLHVHNNLTPMPAFENLSKSNKFEVA